MISIRMNIFPAFSNYILTTILLIPSFGFSQSRHRSSVTLEGFSVKADALSLLNTAIGESTSYSISGELYFNDEYSLNSGLGMERESEPYLNRSKKIFANQLRWYFMQDDCNCSAFFAGIYFSSVMFRQSADHHHNNAVDYNRYSLEGGLCGGYQALLAGHFVVDPVVQAGLELYHHIQSTEPVSSSADFHNKGLQLRMQLGIGYRF